MEPQSSVGRVRIEGRVQTVLGMGLDRLATPSNSECQFYVDPSSRVYRRKGDNREANKLDLG